MTPRYIFETATAADDAAIRHLLATSPVPGAVTLTYEREPDYFLGSGTMGHFVQVGVCRVVDGPHPAGALVGLGCRATRPMFVNGQVTELGYLGQLRVAGQHQGRGVLSGAFRTLRAWHADGRVCGYITTIVEGNRAAEGVLVRHARRPVPAYREVAGLCTLALVVTRLPWLRQRVVPTAARQCAISRGTGAALGEIVAFLQRCGAARQFFPYYTAADFCHHGLTLDFQVSDFVVARQAQAGQIVGVMGLWDQSRYKQTVVHAYQRPLLRRLRRGINLAIRLAGGQPLPPPGVHLRYAYASFVCVQDDDPAVGAALLWEIYRMAAARDYTLVLIGLVAGDPLMQVARRYPHIAYDSRLYTVNWDDEPQPALYERLDGRLPAVEIAAL